MNRKKLKKLYEEYDYESIYDKQIKSLEEYENLRLEYAAKLSKLYKCTVDDICRDLGLL